MKREKSLGRGLADLLRRSDDDVLEAPDDQDHGHKVTIVSLGEIVSNASQPRKYFDEAALRTLADSIAQKGLIYPITVRKINGGKLEIIAGERRFKAAKIAGLKSVPVIIKEADNTLAFELSIIENIQREDLNVVEEAEAYQALMDKYSYSQNDISGKISKSRSHIANMLRLLSLPTKVIVLIKEGKLSAGHAKALIGRDDAERLADEIVANNLNVRATERLTKKNRAPRAKVAALSDARAAQTDDEIAILENLLKEKLSMQVSIDHGKKHLTIWYEDLEKLDMLLQLLSARR